MKFKAPPWRGYLLAAVVTLTAFFIKYFLTKQGFDYKTVNVFFIAVTISAFYGGLGPGFLAMLIAISTHISVFIFNGNKVAELKIDDMVEIGSFLVTIILANAMTSSLFNAKKKAEQNSKKALEYANQKSSFVANVTHEIRSPLYTILGLTDILLKSKVTKDKDFQLLKIKEACESLLNLVNNVLEFSKLELSQTKELPISFDIRQIVNKTLNLTRILAEQKKIKIDSFIAPQVPSRLVGYPNRISQVLINLLNNSIKFTESGFIRVRVLVLDKNETGVDLQIEVEDSGVGVPVPIQEKIFEAFFQGDSSFSKKYKGTGLGLSICKNIVEQMGGQIGVESKPMAGSRFWFTISLPEENIIKNQEITDDTKKIEYPAFDVLVVEDDEIHREITKNLLCDMNCKVTTAGNSTEAITQFKIKKFDLIFMDCHMPEVDGFETTKILRNMELNQQLPRTPIIALTAFNANNNKEHCYESGMDDHITKPITASFLQKYLQKLSTHKSQNSIYYLYLKNTPNRLLELKSALESHDLKNITGQLHNIKSTSGIFGFNQIVQICEEFENLDFEDKDASQAHFSKLEQEIKSTLQLS